MSRVGLGYFPVCQHYCLWVAGRVGRRKTLTVLRRVYSGRDGWTMVALGPAAPPILARSTGTVARRRGGRLADEDGGDDDGGGGARCGRRRRV